jgi:thiocyanate hydrolase subunit beta
VSIRDLSFYAYLPDEGCRADNIEACASGGETEVNVAVSGQFDGVANRVRDLAPVARDPLDSPYEISNQLFAALRHVLHDVGGQPDLPVPFLEKVEEEWEMNTYITCECLGWRGVWNSEERRRAENDLGATLYFGLPYYARWATVAAKTLINKGLITPDELSAKLDEVRSRLEARA